MTKCGGKLGLVLLALALGACAQPDEPVAAGSPSAGAHALVTYGGRALPVSLGVWASFSQRDVSCEHTLVAGSLGIDSARHRYTVQQVIQASCESPQPYYSASLGSYAQTDSLLYFTPGEVDAPPSFGGMVRAARLVLWPLDGSQEYAREATAVPDAAGAALRLESINGAALPAPRQAFGTCIPLVTAGSLQLTRSSPSFAGGATGTFTYEYSDDIPCWARSDTVRYTGTYEQVGPSIRLQADTGPGLTPGFVAPFSAVVAQDRVQLNDIGVMVFRR